MMSDAQERKTTDQCNSLSWPLLATKIQMQQLQNLNFFQCVVWATLIANYWNQRKLVPLSGNLNGLFKGVLLRLEEFLVIGSELDELPHGVTGPEIHCSWTPWLCRRYEAHCRHQRSGWCSWTWLCGVPRPPLAGSSFLWNTARHRINNKNKTALTALLW